ncbi:MAG TPA: DUF2062 domain-containing protein [Vicinamibacterales bacterium]|nr:DUF2062 domain-containing protein [Vicinamibacterales bacterium]
MIRLTRDAVRRWSTTLLHIDDTPRRTAAAFALGVFFGFSPFLGLHTALALTCAFIFGLNRVAVLLGVYSNLPWTIAAWYALTTAVGAAMLRTKIPPAFARQLAELFQLSLLHREFWDGLGVLLRPLLWPYVVGSLLGATALALAIYPLALAFVINERRIHLHRRMHEGGSDAPPPHGGRRDSQAASKRSKS